MDVAFLFLIVIGLLLIGVPIAVSLAGKAAVRQTLEVPAGNPPDATV